MCGFGLFSLEIRLHGWITLSLGSWPVLCFSVSQHCKCCCAALCRCYACDISEMQALHTRRMVAVVVMYGMHAAVSAVVACKAHYARQVLRSSSHGLSHS
jgi:hypothetical protein